MLACCVVPIRSAGPLGSSQQLQALAQPKVFRSFLRQIFRHRWVVYSKPPFGGPDQVLRYLGAYTHRVAISNRRLFFAHSRDYVRSSA